MKRNSTEAIPASFVLAGRAAVAVGAAGIIAGLLRTAGHRVSPSTRGSWTDLTPELQEPERLDKIATIRTQLARTASLIDAREQFSVAQEAAKYEAQLFGEAHARSSGLTKQALEVIQSAHHLIGEPLCHEKLPTDIADESRDGIFWSFYSAYGAVDPAIHGAPAPLVFPLAALRLGAKDMPGETIATIPVKRIHLAVKRELQEDDTFGEPFTEISINPWGNDPRVASPDTPANIRIEADKITALEVYGKPAHWQWPVETTTVNIDEILQNLREAVRATTGMSELTN